jgi:hypothetical protein
MEILRPFGVPSADSKLVRPSNRELLINWTAAISRSVAIYYREMSDKGNVTDQK